MPNLAPETQQRLQKFMQSPQYQSLSPKTQQRLTQVTGYSAPERKGLGQNLKEWATEDIPQNFSNALKKTFSPETVMTVASIAPLGKLAGAMKFIAPSARIKLAERAQALIPKAKAKASESFGKAIEDIQSLVPGKRVDVSSVLKEANAAAGVNSSVRSVVRKADLVRKYADNPDLAKNLTLSESQDLLNSLNSAVKKGIRKGDVLPEEIPIAKLMSSLQKTQEEAFPLIVKERAKYASVKQARDILKGTLTPQTTLKSIRGAFATPQINQAYKQLGKYADPKLLTESSNYALGANALRAGVVGGLYLGGRDIAGRLRGD